MGHVALSSEVEQRVRAAAHSRNVSTRYRTAAPNFTNGGPDPVTRALFK